MNKVLQITLFVILSAMIVSGVLYYVITKYAIKTPSVNDDTSQYTSQYTSQDTSQDTSYQNDTEEVYN